MMVLALPHRPAHAFRAAYGSVAGLEHRRLGRNNQDAAAVAHDGGVAVAVVTDGCSSGASSEVGARLAAAWLSTWLAEIARAHESPAAWASAVELRLVDACRDVARTLARDDASLRAVVGEYFLFTFLAAVVAPSRVAVLGAGDGVYSVDGVAHVLAAGEGNAPDYVGYGILDGAGAPRVRVLFEASSDSVASLSVCTDGACDLLDRAPAELSRLEQDPRILENPSLLRKRLTVLAERDRLLFDDTTIAVLARDRGGAS